MAEVIELVRRKLRSRPLDHPGNDVGERLRVLHVTISLDWHEANPKMRHRGEKVYPREDIARHASYQTALSHEYVDAEHRAQVVHAIARFLWQGLNADDWPGGRRDIAGRERPGA